MATSLPCYLAVPNPRAVARASEPPKSPFLSSSKFFSVALRRSEVGARRCFHYDFKEALKDIPKQFREENLPDGLIDNYKNFPKLSPSQMRMMMSKDVPQQEEEEEEEDEEEEEKKEEKEEEEGEGKKIDDVEIDWLSWEGEGSGPKDMYDDDAENPPPDIASYYLAKRIIYLGMPIVQQVSKLIVQQFLYLRSTDLYAPICLYIDSTGTLNEKGEIVGSETDAYSIADAMLACEEVITVNLSSAEGQAAMLLSLGHDRYVLPSSSTVLYLPGAYRSSGRTTDMWAKRAEMDMMTKYHLELLSEGTGKTVAELHKDIQRTKVFFPKDAIEYGIADKIYRRK